MSPDRVVHGACHHDCPDTCVWDVTVSDGQAVSLRGNRDHPTTRGQLCPKVNRFLERVYHPDRLLTPMRRNGPKGAGSFEPISWPEAIDEIAGHLGALVDAGRAASILQFSFDGTQGLIQKGVMADRFFDALGASDIGRHLCGVTSWFGAADVYGQPFGMDPEAMRSARTIVLWGTNTLVTNRHLWPIVDQARRDGATVVVIDPVRTATAERADVFLQIRPGADVALVLAMIHVLDRDGLLDDAWLAEHTAGWVELRASAAEWHPARAAVITGIPADAVEALAHRYARDRPAAIRVLVGPEHREHGRNLMRAIAMLPAVTGAWREVGGGLARSTQIWFETALNLPERTAVRRTFNMARLGEILTDRTLDPMIDALVVHNSNPAVIVPDENRVIAGLSRDDLFTVVIEQFMTDTARHADILLPATTQIEHLDLAIAWGHLYLALNQPAIEPLGQALRNSEIFRRLAAAMGLVGPGFTDDDETLVRQLLDSDHHLLDGITYDGLARDTWARLNVPAGHRPHVDALPDTPERRLQLGEIAHRVGSETPTGDPERAHRYPLTLLSRKQHTTFLNTNYGGFDAHLPPEREPRLQIHPDDADERGIATGDAVLVGNDRGRLTLTAVVSDELQPGVVAVPFGWWQRSTPEGRTVNALTNPAVGVDGLGSAAFHETLVDVVRDPGRR